MHRRGSLALLIVVLLSGALLAPRPLAAATAHHSAPAADQPVDLDEDSFDTARQVAELTAARRSKQFAPTTCDGLLPQITKGGFTDPVFVLSDAELIPGSNGRHLCVFWDNLLRSYGIWPINLTGIEEFRALKERVLPHLAEAGVDPCQVSFWAPVLGLGNTIAYPHPGQMTMPNDWHDVEQPCEPRFVAHGPLAESRLGLIQSTFAEARATAERVYGWRLSWPLAVHVYDDKETYLDGLLADGGSDRNRELSRSTNGMAIVSSSRMATIAIDASAKDLDQVRATTAHEFGHIVQAGVVGCSCSLPQFAIEGGAEYFASIAVGRENRALAGRFQNAVDDVQASRQRPLNQFIKDFGNAPPEAYSRGYSALLYFESRWGRDQLLQLHRDAADQTEDVFLQMMSRITGLTLDEFDRDLNGWLRSFSKPAGP